MTDAFEHAERIHEDSVEVCTGLEVPPTVRKPLTKLSSATKDVMIRVIEDFEPIQADPNQWL